MLSVLAWVIAGLLFAVVVLGATPVTCEFRLTRDPELRFRVLLRFLGGVTPGVTITDSARPKRVGPKTDRKRRKRKRPSHRPKAGLIAPRRVGDLAREVLRSVHVTRLSVSGRFGTGDPAETGRVFGLLAPLVYGLAPTCPKADISVVPVFDETCLEGRVSGEVRAIPFAVLLPVARFGLHMVMR